MHLYSNLNSNQTLLQRLKGGDRKGPSGVKRHVSQTAHIDINSVIVLCVAALLHIDINRLGRGLSVALSWQEVV